MGDGTRAPLSHPSLLAAAGCAGRQVKSTASIDGRLDKHTSEMTSSRSILVSSSPENLFLFRGGGGVEVTWGPAPPLNTPFAPRGRKKLSLRQMRPRGTKILPTRAAA